MSLNINLENYKGYSLNHLAFKNESSKRKITDPEIDEDLGIISDPHLIDKCKIKSSESYGRLSEIAQVFPSPDNYLIRNRGTHSNEVSSYSSIAAHFLELNVRLVEAISLGHDTGHVPFGHIGEVILTKLSGQKVRHEKLAMIKLQYIEREGKGLNLTHETLEGIYYHSRGSGELNTTNIPEYDLVMFLDKICYVFSDINDMLRKKIIKETDDIFHLINYFGNNRHKRIKTCLIALIIESIGKNKISFSENQTAQNFNELKNELYYFYNGYGRDDFAEYIEITFDYLNRVNDLKKTYIPMVIANMTDREVIKIAKEMALIGKPADIVNFRGMGFMESLPFIPEYVDFNADYLNWAT